jgi:DNA-binding NarL/FixJ family response regulator
LGQAGQAPGIQDRPAQHPIEHAGSAPSAGRKFTTDDYNLDSLSFRQREVLRLIAEGQSTKQVAATLGISFKTADTHRSNLMQKLNAHETATLVRLAVRFGLVAP